MMVGSSHYFCAVLLFIDMMVVANYKIG